jgi:hypothetical protein
MIFNKQKKRWVFGEDGCIFSGFVMYFIGTTTIFLMAFISSERFYLNYYLKSTKQELNIKRSIKVVLACSMGALFWSILPIFGWSYYSLEGTLTSCSVEWFDRSMNVASYNIAMFIFVYIIPLTLIVVSSFGLILIVSFNLVDNFNFKLN